CTSLGVYAQDQGHLRPQSTERYILYSPFMPLSPDGE
ncbi:MAG: hypothetical protein ACJAS9_003669, partial [Polaribacter sp.]